MPYIKLLTALAGLALLTACGGGTGLTATNDTITPECMTNPFGADCNRFAEALLLRESICMGESTSTRCTPIVTPICELDFNNALCRGRAKYDDLLAEATCAGIPACADGVITYADWLEIASPDATPNTTTRRNQFLQGDATTGLNAGVGYSVNSGQPQPTAFIVDFENGSSRFRLTGIAGGQAADGFAIFRGTIGDVRHFYASILPTTNLGAPITRITGTADWPGRGVIDFGGLDSAFEDFVLTVDFGKREVSSPASVNGNLSLKGTWDERGVITGTTLNAAYLDDARTMLDVGNPANTPGILTGLIGQDGAVGIFYSNNDGIGTSPYIGGFIAAPDPCVKAGNCMANHAAWLGSFGASPPPATRAASNAGTDTFGDFLNLASDVRAISETGFGASTVTKGILTLDGDGTDGMHGVVYLGGANATNNNRQAFVAVLPTTNLGAPLVSPPTTIIWPGKYHNLTFGNAQDANFVINFGEKTITATPVDTTGATTNFALRFTPATGVITGTVTRGTTATARGLIGTNGLVGVFVDTRTGRPAGDSVLFGGFVADNPDN